jgi:outer membrane protein OmpA-like peptidoglycan-associated protein
VLTLSAPGALAQIIQAATAESVAADADAEMSYLLPLPRLVASWPVLERLSGLARVRVVAAADAAAVARVVDVRVDEVAFDGHALGALQLRVWTPYQGSPSTVEVTLEGPLGRVTATLILAVDVDAKTGALVWGSGGLEGRLEARGLDLAWLAATWPALALGGAADLDATLAGAAERPKVDLTLRGRDVTWRGEVVGEVDARLALADERADLALRLGAAASPTATLDLRVPLALDLRARDVRWLDAGPHRLGLAAHGLTAERARPWWRAPGGVDFVVDVDATGEGSLDALKLSAALAGNLTSGGAAPVPVRATIEATSSKQSLTAALGEGLATLEIEARANLVAARRSHASLAPAPLSGRLALDLPLPLVGPFLPSIVAAPAGSLTGAIAVGGTLGAPTLNGRVDSKAASLTLIPMNRRIADLQVKAAFVGDRLDLEAFEGTSDQGKLTAKGTARLVVTPVGAAADAGLWSAWKLDASAHAALARFPVVQPDVPIGLVDATLDAVVKAGPGDLGVSLTLGGVDAQLTSERVPRASAIPTNAGVRFVDWMRGASERGGAASVDRFALDVALADPMRVHGEGSELTLDGRFALERLGPVVRVDGGLDVQPGGNLTMFGHRFDVRGGQFTLAEGHLGRTAEAGPDGAPDAAPKALPGEAVMNLVTRGLAQDTHVLLKVQGPAARPSLVMVSVPPLPEYQILTLLILGRLDVVDDRNGEVRREAAALVNRFHNPGLKRQLFDRLGVDKVGLGFGSSVSQPIVTVGKQVTRTLYLETTYRVNAPPDQNEREGRVEYQLSPHWALNTVFGDAAEGGLGVFWSTRFGGPPPPAPPPDTWGLRARKERGDRDADGVLNPYDLCLEQPEDRDGFVDDDGCPDPDNDADGVPDVADAAPLEPETSNGFDDGDGRPDEAPVALQGLVARLGGFTYPANASRLPVEGEGRLRAAAALLTMLPGVKVEIVGHSDDQGTPTGNRRVSLLRANAARAFLAARGIPPARTSVVGRGNEQPLDPGSTDEARARNRRIELRFYEP